MTRVKIITTPICLIASCAGWFFLGCGPLHAAPQQGTSASSSVPSTRPKATKPATHRAIKRTWHSGPASTPPETEAVPSRPPAAPPRVATTFDPGAIQKKPASRNAHTVAPASSIRVAKVLPAAPAGQAPRANADQPDASNAADPEAQRVQDEFARLREDAGARRAFYDDLLGTVERVRAGVRNEGSPEEKWVKFQPVEHPTAQTSSPPVSRPHLPEPNSPPEPSPAKPAVPQSSLGPDGNRIDPVAYQRVVRWAKANGTLVPLALGVAWMESQLNTNAPHGAAGEVGMFQIMPERCRLEGWSPVRLVEPEFNAWMGTMLLAQYYQEEGSVARAAAKYVAGPGVFDKEYSRDMWAYINWYAATVESYASYFSGFPS